MLECTGGTVCRPYKGKLELAVPADAAQLQYYEVLIPKNAQHPNAAILFALYLMTEQGQRGIRMAAASISTIIPKPSMHKFVADNEAKGIKFHRIDYRFWKDNPGIDGPAASWARR